MPKLTAKQFALDVVQRLRQAGYEALWAGGCVRDKLVGKTPKDYDVATNAVPSQVRELFGPRRTLAVGEAFGVIVVLGPRGVEPIEVTTFRQDDSYSDGRRPDSVTFSSAEQDAQRRDFTINGLFYDPVEQQVIDYVDGQRDLKRKIIRAIGNATDRFTEDKLRMLRAVRFAAVMQFEIEPDTLHAIQEMAEQVNQVSAERIGAETRRMLCHPTRPQALELIETSKLLVVVLPELHEALKQSPDRAALWESLLAVSKRLEETTFPVALAALLEVAGCSAAVAALVNRFRLSNKEAERTGWLLDNLSTIAQATTCAWPKLQRVLVQPGAADLLKLHAALTSNDDKNTVYCQQKRSLPAEQFNPEPLITGADLIQCGLTPGKSFQLYLEQIRDAQLLGKISTHAEAIEWVEQLAKTQR